jgi:cytochrome oxidase assembly protein ShyY1
MNVMSIRIKLLSAWATNKILFLWVASIIVSIITLLLIYFKISPAQNNLALHYNVVFGVDTFGSYRELYKLPLISFFIAILNFGITRALKIDRNFLSYMAAWISLLVSLIIFLSVIFLFQVN